VVVFVVLYDFCIVGWREYRLRHPEEQAKISFPGVLIGRPDCWGVRRAASRSCDHPLVLGYIALPAVHNRTTESRYIAHTLRTLCNVQYESYATCDARF
jgi:dienelactone hydrolase